METLKEIGLIIYAVFRIIFIFLFLTLPVKLFAKLAIVKQIVQARYYRWKFPGLQQMRKVVGAELATLTKELEEIRNPAKMSFLDEVNMSKSQRKKTRAKVHNAEREFFQKNNLILVAGLLYRKD